MSILPLLLTHAIGAEAKQHMEGEWKRRCVPTQRNTSILIHTYNAPKHQKSPVFKLPLSP